MKTFFYDKVVKTSGNAIDTNKNREKFEFFMNTFKSNI